MAKPEQSLERLNQALERFKEALDESPSNRLIVDGTIQRFEFCFEACWKTLRKALFDLGGVESAFPRDVLKKAYAGQWIGDEALWLAMLNDRNETSHVYDEAKAKEIYSRLKNYYPLMLQAYETLSHRYSSKEA